MKLRPAHYSALRDAIAPLAPKLAAYRAHLFTVPSVRDADKATRWGLLHAAKVPADTMRAIYAYCDDSHIDTALRAIVAEITAQPEPATP